MDSAYSRPILIPADQSAVVLLRVALEAAGAKEYNEAWLQTLLYRHPEALPVAEINESFAGLIPVCRELRTPAGPIDVLYATPQGRITILEAKLWRNPEARRQVIGQILDYAKELSHWSYEDLNTAVRAARHSEFGAARSLFDVVAARDASVDEARFVDAVQRNLRRGDFLLLIAGDGIRENVGAITSFIEAHGTLHFTFGLVEMGIYQMPDGSRLVQPRILAQSTIVRRIVVELREGGAQEVESGEAAEQAEETGPCPDLEEQRQQFSDFWRETLERYPLDDRTQPVKGPAKGTNQFFYLPQEAQGWICGVAAKASGATGVYLSLRRGPIPDRLYASLLAQQAEINEELGHPVQWKETDDWQGVSIWRNVGDDMMTTQRAEVQQWLGEVINRFINAFRPRVISLLKDVS